jgi:hypothetical protein
VEFILYIEKLRGASIDFDQLDIDSLRTLRDIERNYLTSPSPASDEVDIST